MWIEGVKDKTKVCIIKTAYGISFEQRTINSILEVA